MNLECPKPVQPSHYITTPVQAHEETEKNNNHVWISHVGTFLIGTRYGVKKGRKICKTLVFNPKIIFKVDLLR